MNNYKKLHYEEYYIMRPDGSNIKTDRRKCFAPAGPTESQYSQRWYYSPDCKLAIRLPRDENGERIGKSNAADLKAQERYTEKKHKCIGNTSHASCPVTCDTCPCRDYCTSEHLKNNGIGCASKCDYCHSYVGRTVEMDRTIGEEDDGAEITMELPDESENIETTYTENEKAAIIQSVIASLKPEDKTLWNCLISKVKKEKVARLLGLTVDGVTYRKKRLERILLANPDLKKYFEKF